MVRFLKNSFTIKQMLCCYVTFSLINHAHMCRTVLKLFEVPQYTILKSHLSKK